MMYEYRVVELKAGDGATVYGIDWCMSNRALCRLSVLFPDRGKMEQIAAICTKEQVEPIHVDEVAYDTIMK